MKPLNQKGSVKIFYSTSLAWLIAQGLKVLIYWIRNHKINFRLFVGTGGMPSSHSAFVSCLAASIGLEMGFDSPVFYLALGVALIVMTDAAGVRRAAGQQAKILNEIMEDFYSAKPFAQQKLRELLGHTPVQVLVGALLGILTSILFYKL